MSQNSPVMTHADFERFMDTLTPKIVEMIGKIVEASRAQLLKRIDALEIETKAMSARLKNLGHRGTYKSDTTYFEGNFITSAGSLFCALKDNPQGIPGSSDDWRLCAKRGRDGDRGRTVRLRDNG